MVVDGRNLVEDRSLCFETLVRPPDLKAISKRSVACNHITRAMVASAPTFVQVAARIHAALDGRIDAREAKARLNAIYPNVPLSNGFLYGREGAALVGYAADA